MHAINQTSSQATNQTSNPSLVNGLPIFVKRYLEIRSLLDILERDRRELEAQVIEWGLLCINAQATNGQVIADTEDKELLLTVRKPTLKDLKDDRLTKLAEAIEEERSLAIQENQARINTLMARQQAIKEELAQLTITAKGKELEEERDNLTDILLGVSIGKLGLMLRKKISPSLDN